VLGLRQAHRGLAIFPFAALFEEFHSLEALENGTFATDGGARLEAIVLGHLEIRLKNRGRRKLGTPFPAGNPKKQKNHKSPSLRVIFDEYYPCLKRKTPDSYRGIGRL
jgi:hypothetical protein